MVFLRRAAVVAAACVLAGACGGSSFNGISGGDDGGGSEGGSGGEGGGSDARSDGSSSSGGDDASLVDVKGDVASDVKSETASDATSEGAADVVITGDAPADGPTAPCPTVGGAYTLTLVEAQGCGDLNALAPQCIVQDVCAIQFQSNPSGGTKPAINGDPTLQQDGSFTGGALKEGTGNRTGCTGTWNAALSTMTVDCGGTGSSQACVVALKRVADKCP
jgi:hypothetical protein